MSQEDVKGLVQRVAAVGAPAAKPPSESVTVMSIAAVPAHGYSVDDAIERGRQRWEELMERNPEALKHASRLTQKLIRKDYDSKMDLVRAEFLGPLQRGPLDLHLSALGAAQGSGYVGRVVMARRKGHEIMYVAERGSVVWRQGWLRFFSPFVDVPVESLSAEELVQARRAVAEAGKVLNSTQSSIELARAYTVRVPGVLASLRAAFGRTKIRAPATGFTYEDLAQLAVALSSVQDFMSQAELRNMASQVRALAPFLAQLAALEGGVVRARLLALSAELSNLDWTGSGYEPHVRATTLAAQLRTLESVSVASLSPRISLTCLAGLLRIAGHREASTWDEYKQQCYDTARVNEQLAYVVAAALERYAKRFQPVESAAIASVAEHLRSISQASGDEYQKSNAMIDDFCTQAAALDALAEALDAESAQPQAAP